MRTMTLKVYRRRPGETGPPDDAPSVVCITVDPDTWHDAFREAVTGAWPPCRCPKHRNQPNAQPAGGA
ncbi:hypothetical protein ACMA1D_16235 [Streptomyces sp. 796.1]|uniref:hypothetical protein n=1 Tax=Streptomyces sp. 796.1 TaxID=3163029 RepID=UPI0039C97A99